MKNGIKIVKPNKCMCYNNNVDMFTISTHVVNTMYFTISRLIVYYTKYPYTKCPLYEISVYEMSIYEMSVYEVSDYPI